MNRITLDYLFKQINQNEFEYDQKNKEYALDFDNKHNLKDIYNLIDVLESKNKSFKTIKDKIEIDRIIIFNQFVISFYCIDIYTIREFIFVLNKDNKHIKVFNNGFDSKNNFNDLLKYLNLK